MPTLLIVGRVDDGVIELNEQAFSRLRGPKALEIVPGASHLFPEPDFLPIVKGESDGAVTPPSGPGWTEPPD
jgi:fermentation-respiration switch protein FrsA (DUF1100 family)